MVFTREEEFLAKVPEQQVELYTTRVLNPIKVHLDEQYAAEGTFYSDLGILLATVLKLGYGKNATELPQFSAIQIALGPDSQNWHELTGQTPARALDG
jgi:hypothetical protein